ncbi:virulence-associated E family protein [Shouchella lonarensis]|uniref:Virulence-associated protein E n=1 Tax=Shouchella lonarensis TaxID=1464122 RepID=A0A1G6HRG1_9BACI|nr:virulence-associated E family protein [Shouchella lonarensis]SDB96791.1 Virulence-associated protein E [Shouchella lonarensis]
MTIKHDRQLMLAVGQSRFETTWKNKSFTWLELVTKLSQTTRTPETMVEYKKMSRKQQGQTKDIGGFVGGSLKKSGRRKADNVKERYLITLDADHLNQNDPIVSMIDDFFNHAIVIYSTHSHTQEKPRLRLVIPLARPVTADEYTPLARRVAADLGINKFDDTTYEAHRLMYWPSTPQDGEYFFKVKDAPFIDPDDVLARYNNWRDSAEWPESDRRQTVVKRLAAKQGDPHTKPGLIGAFCRTYTITEAIYTMLGDVYESAGNGRYTYQNGSTTGGLVLYDNDTFAYSHHATDPISGRLVNAFDLVRIHKFGAQDDDAEPGTPVVKLPSFMAMIELAQKDENVKRQLAQEKIIEVSEEFGEVPQDEDDTEWTKKLSYSKKGILLNTAPNIQLILQNHPELKGKIGYNQFANRHMVLGDLPWRKLDVGDTWQDRDDASLENFMERYYGITGSRKIFNAFSEASHENGFHPIRDYLSSLVWDNVPRLDALLVDYLGAEDTEYVRAVTRKAFTAAVARIYEPGIKFDNVLVMVGAQGVGKSHLIKKMGKDWYSDSFSTVLGKEAMEQIQGFWIIEMAELSAMRKADVEPIKQFISKQEDAFRVAYGRQVSIFKRQCVFFGTTNDISFLRDKTGNRRFWPVVVDKAKATKSSFKDLTDDEIGQVWAEAVQRYKGKEPLILEGEVADRAQEAQELHMEENDLFGLIQEFLEYPVPENWHEKNIQSRKEYFHSEQIQASGQPRERICAMEIWAELLQGDPKQFTPIKSREINDVLKRIPGWKPHSTGRGRLRFGKEYGTQKAFIREK